MASTIAAVRAAIQARLETITALNTAPFIPSSITFPMAVVGVPPIPNYHETMQRGYFELDFPITVMVSKALDQKSQDDLTAYADITGTNSIINAIYGDKTLGGTVEDCKLVSFLPITNADVGVFGYLGGLFTLRVAMRAS